MICSLMHRLVPVTQIAIDDETAAINEIGNVLAPEHLRIGEAMCRVNNNPVYKSLERRYTNVGYAHTPSGGVSAAGCGTWCITRLTVGMNPPSYA